MRRIDVEIASVPQLAAELGRASRLTVELGEVRVLRGEKGDPGASAYEIATENGFVGTEAEWLDSLVGAKGEQGEPGEKGDKGDPGAAYGTCSTAAGTRAKVVACAGFTRSTGSVISVKFTNAQSYSASASYPVTMNVNSTGAAQVRIKASAILPQYAWQAGEVVTFVFDGTYWIMTNGGRATTTYYGLTRLSTDVANPATDCAATPSAVKAVFDFADTKQRNWTVLWENSSPTAVFAAQEVTVSGLSDCNLFYAAIGWDRSYPDNEAGTMGYLRSGKTAVKLHPSVIWYPAGNKYICATYRDITITPSESKIKFDTGHAVYPSSAVSDGNGNAIPLYILGTKI